MTDLDLAELCGPEFKESIRESYSIPKKYFTEKVKRGLRNSDGTGVMAGVTRIGRVIGYNMEDGEVVPIPGRLYYRGINVADIAENHVKNNTFGYEEVSYLLLMGKLPTHEELDLFKRVGAKARALPNGFMEDVMFPAPSPTIMNMLSRAVMALYSYDEDADGLTVENMLSQSVGLISRFPVIVANAYAVKSHRFDGKSLHIHSPKLELSAAENFLRMVRADKSYTQEEAHLLDLLMILHAEHGGGNNSAFVCRTLASSGTDTYSVISGAASSLKGALHGGANAKVTSMINDIKDHVVDPENDEEMSAYLGRILDKKENDQSGKIYGLGHAVYTISDPRAVIIKRYATEMAKTKGHVETLAYLNSIERNGGRIIMERKGFEYPLCANVDLYSGFVLHMLGIPDELFTSLFALSRISGWCAHRIEEVTSGKRIMRPAYRYAEDDNVPKCGVRAIV